MFVACVGKPSSGKSTFFKATTLMDVAIANYPFTTIKPNSGIGFVKIDCAFIILVQFIGKKNGKNCSIIPVAAKIPPKAER